jgi:hypothetical protein
MPSRLLSGAGRGAIVELSGFTRMAIKIAGLFMIAISLDSLPTHLVRLLGAGLPGDAKGLLGSFLFVPALISIAVGAVLVFRADVITGRIFKDDGGGAAPPADNARAFEEAAIFLLGLYIFVVAASELGYYLFNYGFMYFQKPAGSYPYPQALPMNYGIVFALVLRFLMAFALIFGANNLSRLHQRILTYRPMKDVRDV